jgi:hypothetical protein
LGTATCLKAVAEVRVVTDSASASKVDGDIFMVNRSYTTILASLLISGICSIYSWLAFNPFMQRGGGAGVVYLTFRFTIRFPFKTFKSTF